MFAKSAVVFFFAQALLIQSALSQCTSRAAVAAGPGLAGPYGLAGSYDGLTNGFAGNGLVFNGLAGNGLACNGLAGNSLAYDGLVGLNGAGMVGLGYNGLAGNALAYDNFYAPALEIAPTSGGALPVTSASAVAPNSVLVASENVYEGALEVIGELPFLGTVGLEGVVPSAGAGAVNHACGNGATRMVSQNGAAVSAAPGFGAGYGAGFAPALGLGFGNVYGQGIGAFGNAAAFTPAAALAGTAPFGFGAGLAELAYPGAGLLGAYPGEFYGAGLAPYGGAGEGNVAVAGELPVAGSTAVAGQVPIMGAVNFGGAVPAAGTVSISGNCACGCGSPYMY